jgi:lysozyme family protein
MADLEQAISYVLGFEDSRMSGEVTTGPDGRTRFGISEASNPWAAAIGLYTTSLAVATGMAWAALAIEYGVPLKITEIRDQDIANKLLSLGVNEGITEPSKWLQEAVGAIPDGSIGPATIAAVNKANSQTVLASLKKNAVAYYQQLAANNPAKYGKFLAGWLRRAEA